MPMYNPPHPGGIVKEECIEAAGLTVTDAAEGLGVSRSALSSVLNERAAISPEMALRFEAAGWGVAESWLRMQLAYDLWQAKHHMGKRIINKVKKFHTPQPA